MNVDWCKNWRKSSVKHSHRHAEPTVMETKPNRLKAAVFSLVVLCGMVAHWFLLNRKMSIDATQAGPMVNHYRGEEYERGYNDAVAEMENAAAHGCLWRGPLVITNNNLVLSNCMIVTVYQMPYAFSVENSTNVTFSGNYFRSFIK